jgi:hypothetical protein
MAGSGLSGLPVLSPNYGAGKTFTLLCSAVSLLVLLLYERIPEFIDNFCETINFSEALFSHVGTAQSEFEHNTAITVGYNQYVVCQGVLSVKTGLCDCLNE